MSLAAADALAARIVAGTSDAVLFADRDGLIRFWNRGAEEMFGWPAAEILGRSMDVIIPDRLRARHWDGWSRVMETGVTRYGKDVLAVPALHCDGRQLSIEFTIALLRGEDGRILGPRRRRPGRDGALRAREGDAGAGARARGEAGRRGRPVAARQAADGAGRRAKTAATIRLQRGARNVNASPAASPVRS
jgi:PAS domain S-box-containing protein